MQENTPKAARTITVELDLSQTGVAVVVVRGEHDLSTAPRIAAALADAGKLIDILVDLSDCTFMDSTVIKTLLDTRRDLDERAGVLALVIPPEARAVRRIAEITGLNEILPILASRQEAAATFRRASG